MNKLSHFFVKFYKSYNTEAPIYFYDIDKIVERLNNIAINKPKNLKILFPIKSFPHKQFIENIMPFIDGFDISDQKDFDLIENKNKIFWCSRTYFSPFHESVIFDHQNLNGDLSAKYNSLRLKTNADSRFGVALNELTNANLKNYQGFHFHDQNWQENSFSQIKENIEILLKNKNIPKEFKINLGGGFNFTTFETSLSFISEICQKYPAITFCIEPGRSLVQDYGFICGKVLEIQKHNNKQFLISSISKSCHLRWEVIDGLGCQSNFYHFSSDEEELGEYEYILAGATNYEADQIGVFKTKRKIQKDDIICLSGISGYGYAWNHSFNSVPRADIKLKYKGKIV